MHVAIIMDGNGRWAGVRGLPRTAGHRAGAKVVRRIVEEAAKLPIGILTLYAFSCDNWSRPSAEIRSLFGLMKRYLRSEASRCVDNGVAVEFIGRRDRLGEDLLGQLAFAELVEGALPPVRIVPVLRAEGAHSRSYVGDDRPHRGELARHRGAAHAGVRIDRDDGERPGDAKFASRLELRERIARRATANRE